MKRFVTHPPGATGAMSGLQAGTFSAKKSVDYKDSSGLHSLGEASIMSMKAPCGGGCDIVCKVDYASHGLGADLKPDIGLTAHLAHAPGADGHSYYKDSDYCKVDTAKISGELGIKEGHGLALALGIGCKIKGTDLKPDDGLTCMVHAPGQSHGYLGANFTECDFHHTGLSQSAGKICETHPALAAAALLAAHHSMAAITAGAAMPMG